MKRILIIVPLLLLIGWAIPAVAQEGHGGRITADLVVDSSGEIIEMSFPNPEDGETNHFPTSFTLYSNDAAAFWIQRRFAEGLRDTVPIPVPAGRSIKIPAPPPVISDDGDYYFVTIFVGGHTDSVYALPWYE